AAAAEYYPARDHAGAAGTRGRCISRAGSRPGAQAGQAGISPSGRPKELSRMINKQVADLAAALDGIKHGSTVLLGGFGAVGQPDELIDALLEQGATDLTVVANNAGTGMRGLAGLIAAGRVRKMICSYPASDDPWAFVAA